MPARARPPSATARRCYSRRRSGRIGALVAEARDPARRAGCCSTAAKVRLQQSCKKLADIGQHHPEDTASVVLWAGLVAAVSFVMAGGYAEDVLF